MAADAILLDRSRPHLLNMNHLRLEAEREHERMARTVHCLEQKFVEDIILRHMAIVADGNASMTASFPRCVLRRHHVAIHARFRIVGKIRRGVADIERQHAESDQYSRENENGETPPRGRRDGSDEAVYGIDNVFHKRCSES